jgi:hypothetical protein
MVWPGAQAAKAEPAAGAAWIGIRPDSQRITCGLPHVPLLKADGLADRSLMRSARRPRYAELDDLGAPVLHIADYLALGIGRARRVHLLAGPTFYTPCTANLSEAVARNPILAAQGCRKSLRR